MLPTMTETQIRQLFAVDLGLVQVSREFQLDNYLLSVFMTQWGGDSPAAAATYWELQTWIDASGMPQSRSCGMSGTADQVAKHYAERCANAEHYIDLGLDVEHQIETDHGEQYDAVNAWMY